MVLVTVPATYRVSPEPSPAPVGPRTDAAALACSASPVAMIVAVPGGAPGSSKLSETRQIVGITAYSG